MSLYRSIAVCISRNARRRSRSFSLRTLERASGTDMPVRISRIVKATISSISENPRWFRRLLIHLFYADRKLWSRREDGLGMRITQAKLRHGHDRIAASDRLK